jgi:hypothetical protein
VVRGRGVTASDVYEAFEIDVQMVGSETNHHFKKLALAVNTAQKSVPRDLLT